MQSLILYLHGFPFFFNTNTFTMVGFNCWIIIPRDTLYTQYFNFDFGLPIKIIMYATRTLVANISGSSDPITMHLGLFGCPCPGPCRRKMISPIGLMGR